MNLEELKKAICDYHESDEETFLENLDLIIRHSEEALYRAFEFPAVRKEFHSNFLLHIPGVAMPEDFLTMYSFGYRDAGGKARTVWQKADGYMRAAFPSRTEYGLPRFYEVTGERNIEVAPTPDATYEIEAVYYAMPESIVDTDNGRSYLGDHCSEALLAECLVRAAIFLKADDSLMKTLLNGAKEAAGNLSALGISRIKTEATRP